MATPRCPGCGRSPRECWILPCLFLARALERGDGAIRAWGRRAGVTLVQRAELGGGLDVESASWKPARVRTRARRVDETERSYIRYLTLRCEMLERKLAAVGVQVDEKEVL